MSLRQAKATETQTTAWADATRAIWCGSMERNPTRLNQTTRHIERSEGGVKPLFPLCVTDCVKMYENRQFENAGSNRLDQASLASMIGDADDAQSREVYGSIWPRMRKLLPSMTTVSAWCSSRSRMAAVRVRSLLNILGHSLNARFEVSMIEPCS